MTEKIQRFIRGYVRIRVRTVSYDRFLNICALHGFYIWDLTPKENAYELNISIKDFRKLRPLARKTGAHIRIVKKRGLPFWLFRNRHRKAFAVGFLGGRPFCSCFLFLSGILRSTATVPPPQRSFTVISRRRRPPTEL